MPSCCGTRLSINYEGGVLGNAGARRDPPHPSLGALVAALRSLLAAAI